MHRPIVTILLSAVSAAVFAQAPAFPGAEGSGRFVTGGRGGKVVHVTNLNDDGPGSLRAALAAKGGHKIIVFDVAGVIPLKSDLEIHSNTSILGQTAPYPGITLRYYTTQIKGSNVIVRFMRFRRGNEKNVNNSADTFWGNHRNNLMIDHCSMSWSIDEIGSFYDNNNTTLQWCVYGESLNNAGHKKGPHGYGGIWGGKLASFHHNMIAHTTNRAPRFNGARYNWTGYTKNKLYSKYKWQNAVQAENVDFRNNLIFDWGSGGCYGGPGGGYINMINNYYRATPETKSKNKVTLIDYANKDNADKTSIFYGMTSRYYIHGNAVNAKQNYDWTGVQYEKDGLKNGDIVKYNGEYYSRDSLNAYGNAVKHYTINGGTYIKIKADKENEAPVGLVTTHTADQAYEKVLKYGGASLYRDDVDARYIEECRKGESTYTGSVTGVKGRIDVVSDCNGYNENNFPTGKRPAGFDTDGDGMPDEWEKANGLNPRNAKDGNAYTLDTKHWYTNFEVYANSLVEDIMKAENSDAEKTFDEYYPKCSPIAQVNEQLLFTTTFSDFPNLEANNNCPINEDKTARFTGEQVRVKVYNTEIAAGKHLMAAKGEMPYNIIVGPMKSITKVAYTGKGDWKLEAKGDGDNDWVAVTPQNINRTNCQLRFTSADFDTTPFLYSLDIYGNVKMDGSQKSLATVTFHNVEGDIVSKRQVMYGAPLGNIESSNKSSKESSKESSNKNTFKWCASINGTTPVSPETIINGNTDLYPMRITPTLAYGKGDLGLMNDKAKAFLATLDSIKSGSYSGYNGYNGYKVIRLAPGTYDFGNLTELELPCDSIAIIGAGIDSTIILTTPEPYKERLGIADLFYNTHNDIIFQDLTLYNALNKTGKGGRAAVMNDCGNRTIYNRVRMLSIQDTYFSNNNKMQSYFKDCDIHGIVDFICGGGDVRFDNCTLTLEQRNDGKGGQIITAPSTTTDFGYVFNNCRIVNLAKGQKGWIFGRTWRNKPICVWLNTTLDDNAAKTIANKRWKEKGMNNADPRCIGEYNTMNEKGKDITPESNIIVSYDGKHETILNKKQAERFSYDKMFKDWNPRRLTDNKIK